MITYRTLKTQDDLEKAKKLCEENNVSFLQYDILFGAFDDARLVGLSGIVKEIRIEPVINVSGHGHVLSVLLEKCLAIASTITTSIMGLTKNEELVKIFKKHGCYVYNDKVYHVRKNV